MYQFQLVLVTSLLPATILVEEYLAFKKLFIIYKWNTVVLDNQQGYNNEFPKYSRLLLKNQDKNWPENNNKKNESFPESRQSIM